MALWGCCSSSGTRVRVSKPEHGHRQLALVQVKLVLKADPGMIVPRQLKTAALQQCLLEEEYGAPAMACVSSLPMQQRDHAGKCQYGFLTGLYQCLYS